MLYLESLNISLHELMKNHQEVYMIGEDIVDPYGGAFKVTKGLSTKYPDRVLSTPISEAAIIGFGTGLSIEGFKPIVEIMFGDFVTLCTDQLINGASKFSWMYGDNINVPLVVRLPMGGNRGYGPTHSQTLEQLFFGVPGLFIIAPSIFHNVGKLLKNSVIFINQPLLFIENKILYPMEIKIPTLNNFVDKIQYELVEHSNKLFPTIILKTEDTDSFEVSIIVYGGMAHKAVNAAMKKFMEDETSIQIIIPSLIKPIPKEDILNSVKNSNNILIVDESMKYSAWSSELSCLIYESSNKMLNSSIKRITSKEFPIPSSGVLEKLVLPQENDIQKILNNLTK